MKILKKTVIRAEVQTWIGKGDPNAKHFFGYLYDTESISDTGKETKKEHFTTEDAMLEIVSIFNEFYNLDEYVLIFCSRAAFCTL